MLALLCSVIHVVTLLFKLVHQNELIFFRFGSFNERIDSEKDLFILMNEFEQESHDVHHRTEQGEHLSF